MISLSPRTLPLGLLLLVTIQLVLTGCTSPLVANPTPTLITQAIADIPTLTIYTPIPTEIIEIPTATALPIPTQTTAPTETATRVKAIPTASPKPTMTETAVFTPEPTPIPPTVTPFPSATPWPSPTITYPETDILCSDRIPLQDDFLTTVTRIYGLSADFGPTDLVPISNYFGNDVTYGYNTYLRNVAMEDLSRMVYDSQQWNVQLIVLSGYRSYAEQQLAWNKWAREYPDRVHLISAQPGHSEHQLGLTVDFGSPVYGHKFEKAFDQTAEGVWLQENAHNYGFVMSYPEDGFYITGFEYEPWHYRYIGVSNAQKLREIGMSLTEWQLTYLNPPCIPDTSTWPEELTNR